MLPMLRAIWQADAAFPSGAFAFSYGIEGALSLRPDMTLHDFERLCAAVLRQRWASYDRVALLRAFRTGPGLDALATIDRQVEASTVIETLRAGSRRNGASFLAAHARLGQPLAVDLREAVRAGKCLGHIAVMQGALWAALGLDQRHAELCSAYTVASGLITAAVRLGAVGALQGQGVLQALLPLIDDLLATPVDDEAELESFIPFLDVATARHVHAELRLFAN
ncbi:Putative urease accessory protein UreF [Bradyrhizobium sp. ORS 278]|uniref:urease accessory protein UreF n=1 Tax=Bradyrhizobium sp. (strain ORS 278) TaxID=114615 RepID=UPI00015089F1|nr:urease accessory UreF family protein [Bradyrhizobium sp. ORS 278]CAL79529.1 Putative urease accessory protein UreF [Bradyrhizobium sp. ORS 278]